MFECFEQHTFAALFEEIRNQSQLAPDLVVKACSLSRTLESTQHVNVSLGFNIVECCAQNGHYIRFLIDTGEESAAAPPRDVSTVLMASARQLKFPSKLLSPDKYEGEGGIIGCMMTSLIFYKPKAWGLEQEGKGLLARK